MNFIGAPALFTPSGLALNVVQRGGWNVAIRVLDRHQAGPAGVLELVVRALYTGQIPTIGFQLREYADSDACPYREHTSPPYPHEKTAPPRRNKAVCISRTI